MTTKYRDWVDDELSALTGANTDVDNDKLAIVDDSADATKSISPKELIANTAAFLQSGTGAVATAFQEKNRRPLETFDFYSEAKKTAIRAGTQTDVTTEFALAVAEAISSKRALKINSGPQVLAAAQVFTSAVDLYGEGFYSQLLMDSAAAGTVDMLKIVPAAATGIRLFNWRNFRVSAVSGTPGRHAIHIDLSAVGAFVANAVFEKLWLDALGGKGFNLTNPVNTDGFFTSSIEDSYIAGGIYLERAGDSLYILKNTLTGANVGVDVSAVSGAAQLIIEKNSITNAGGAIVLHNGSQARIVHNQIEQTVAYTGAGQASIWVRGDVGEVASAEIRGNNINANNLLAFNIDVENAQDTHIGQNVLDCHNTDNHIDVDASASATTIEDSNDFRVDGSPAAGRITDAGAQTFGPPITVAAFSNSWVAYDAANSPVRYSRNAEGNVQLEGAVKDGTTVAGTTVFTLPAGFRPSKAVYFAVAGNNTGTWEQSTVLVLSTGAVQIMDGAATFLGFGGINFKAAL